MFFLFFCLWWPADKKHLFEVLWADDFFLIGDVRSVLTCALVFDLVKIVIENWIARYKKRFKIMQDEKNDGTLGPREIGVLKTLLKFTITMLMVPVISYFFVKKYILEGILNYENGAVGSAIVTVIVVHIIIAMYIWTAIKEEATPDTKFYGKKD